MRKPLFSRSEELKHLLKLAAPVSAAMLGGLLMQLVDLLFVGPLGPAALGGVSVGGAYFTTLMILGLGLTLSLDFFASHAFGSGKLELCHSYLIQALYLATGASVILMVVMWFAAGHYDTFGVVPSVAAEGKRYLRVVCWSLWPFLLFGAFRQYLQAMGVAMPQLVILLVANLVNAFGNWVFINGHLGSPAMGVAGSALSTCFARLFMLGAIIAYVHRRDARLKLGLALARWNFVSQRAWELVKLGTPSALQMLFEVGVFALSSLLVGRLGAVPLAAHQIVLQLASFTFMVPLGISSAAAVRVGQALGANDPQRAVDTGWAAIFCGLVYAACTAFLMYVFALPLLRSFTIEPQVLTIGTSLMLVAALFQISDATQVIGAGVLRGIGNTKLSMYANLVGHWGLGLPVGYALCFSVGWGARGLWVGLSVGLTAVAGSLVYAWWRKSAEVVGVAA